jgi:hypothetical protein
VAVVTVAENTKAAGSLIGTNGFWTDYKRCVTSPVLPVRPSQPDGGELALPRDGEASARS